MFKMYTQDASIESVTLAGSEALSLKTTSLVPAFRPVNVTGEVYIETVRVPPH